MLGLSLLAAAAIGGIIIYLDLAASWLTKLLEMAIHPQVFVGALVGALMAVPATWYMILQCRRLPTGLAKRILQAMNDSHSKLTTWGLAHVKVNRTDTVLDVGCG